MSRLRIVRSTASKSGKTWWQEGGICGVAHLQLQQRISIKGKMKWVPIKIKEVLSFHININNKSLPEIEEELNKIKGVENKIITIRVSGVLESGKVSDIKLREVIENLYGQGAYCVLKNTAKLTTKEFEEIKVDSGNVEEIEDKIIKEHLGQIKIPLNEEQITNSLMKIFSQEKTEGEKTFEFEDRLKKAVIKALDLKENWK